MPAPSKKLKENLKRLKADAYGLGVLARAINAVESCTTMTNQKQSEMDAGNLREMLLEQANFIYSGWIDAVKSHQILTIINDVLEDAGWDYTTFCVNRDEDDPCLITWFTEE